MAELDEVRQFLAATASGARQLLIVEGPRGIGKSRLLSEAVMLGKAAGLIAEFEDSAASAVLIRPRSSAGPAGMDVAPWSAIVEACTSYQPDAETSLRMRDYGKVVRLSLDTLGDEAVVRMLEDVFDATPQPEVLSLFDMAGGNPRLIIDLATGLAEQEHIAIVDGRVALLDESVPDRVVSTIQSWMGEHSDKCQQLLRIGAVFGSSFVLPEVLDLLDESTASMVPVLDEALGAGLLISDGDRLTFPNNLVWQVIRGSVTVSVRRSMERDVRRMRTERGTEHLGADPMVVGTTPSTELDRNRHAVEAVRSLVVAGRPETAIRVARWALDRQLPEDLSIELRCLLSDVLVMAGNASEGVIEAERVLAASPPPSAQEAAAAGAALMFGLFVLDESRARTRAHAILDRRGLVGHDPDAIIAATVLSSTEWSGGRLREGLWWGHEAAREVGADSPFVWPKLALATKLGELRRFDEAQALIDDAAVGIARLKLAAHLSALSTVRARLLLQAGSLAEARDAALAALDTATELGTPLLVPLTFSTLALVALRSGNLDDAFAYVHRYRAELASGRTLFRSPQYDWVELLATHARSGSQAAAAFLTERCRGLESNRWLFVQEPGAGAWLARLALDIGDRDLAARIVAATERLVQDNPGFPYLAPGAAHARGLLDMNRDRLVTATVRHVDPWARACAEQDLVELDAAAGVFRNRAAAEGFSSTTGRGDDSSSESLAPASDSDDVESAWGTLSDTERTIAELVGQGLTNRQVAQKVYLSPHTVNYHLRAVFRKLGISSRVELVHHWYRNGA
ncbi:helix-turn-helix transcriptional regulator [Nocardia arthritidis]|nr:helix-turn-helix transcriptional regulator [Nocardia arthritidis]